MSSEIVHVVPGLARGGAETILFRMLESMPKEERILHRVVTLLDNVDFDFNEIGVRVEVFPLNAGPIRFVSSFVRLFVMLRNINPRVVQGWLYIGSVMAYFVAPRRAKLVFSFHDGLADLSVRPTIDKIIVKVAAWMSNTARVRVIHLCSNFGMQNHLRLGFPAKKMVVILNGYNSEYFRFSEDSRHRMRKELGIAYSDFVISCFARYNPIKDHATLFRAFKMLSQTQGNPVLVLAGIGTEESNKKLLNDLNGFGVLWPKVRCLGVRNDLRDLYSASDVHVLTSRSEAFPNVLAEAVLCEIPSVSTDVGDVETILGPSRMVVPVGDAEAIAECISWMMSLESEDRRKMGSDLRKRLIGLVGMPGCLESFRCEVWN